MDRTAQTPPWPRPWYLQLQGWRHFFRPRFVLPTHRQRPLTLAIHFGLGSLALFVLALRALFFRRPRLPPARVLFVGRHHLGDFLMTLPALGLARRHLPAAAMATVVQERYRNEFDLSEIGFSTLGEIEHRGFWREVRAWRLRLREGGYDAVVFHRITRPDFPAVLAAYLEHVPHRVGGAEKGLQAFLTDLYCPSGRELVVPYHWHLVSQWLHLPPGAPELRWPKILDLPPAPPRWDLLIAPFAQHTKEWPAERWHALLRHARERGLRVALSAGPDQAGRAAGLIAAFPEVENLSVSSTSMRDLFQNVRASACLVALDTGIRHVAATLGVPCVVLGHGREHFRLFGAYAPTERYLVHLVPCAPCGAEPCPLGHLRCVREISVSSVLEAWQSMVRAS